MRNALMISAVAVFLVYGAFAQQDAPAPAQQTPAETKAPAKADAGQAGGAPPAADPAAMAAPHATRNRNVPPSAVNNSAYILGPEDQIAVFVYQGPEFTGQHMIRPDGKITINLIGDVQASGLSPEALANAIGERLKTYVNDPDVTVSVLAVKSKRYSINGEVNKPGEYPLVVPTKVFQALVNAGGFRDFANQKKITVIHEDGTRSLFNYKEVLAGKKLEQNILIRPGDIIVVK